MASASEIQALLRFLSQDAKVPLPTAMGKVKELREAGLTRSEIGIGATRLTNADVPASTQSCRLLSI